MVDHKLLTSMADCVKLNKLVIIPPLGNCLLLQKEIAGDSCERKICIGGTGKEMPCYKETFVC